jgi:hypothetical protein
VHLSAADLRMIRSSSRGLRWIFSWMLWTETHQSQQSPTISTVAWSARQNNQNDWKRNSVTCHKERSSSIVARTSLIKDLTDGLQTIAFGLLVHSSRAKSWTFFSGNRVSIFEQPAFDVVQAVVMQRLPNYSKLSKLKERSRKRQAGIVIWSKQIFGSR